MKSKSQPLLVEPDELAPRVLMSAFSVYLPPLAFDYLVPGLHLCHILSGTMQFTHATGLSGTAGKNHVVIFYPGRTQYRVQPGAPLIFQQAHLYAGPAPLNKSIPWLSGIGPLPPVIHLTRNQDRIGAMFDEMRAALLSPKPAWRIKSAAAAMELIALLFEAITPADPAGHAVEASRWDKLFARIESGQHLPPVAKLAQELGMSSSHFAREFHKLTNLTPKQYILGRRLWRARGMILEGYPVKSAALENGFDDPLYFSRLFHKVFGHPPSKTDHANAQAVTAVLEHPHVTTGRNIYAPGVSADLFDCSLVTDDGTHMPIAT